MYMPKSFVETRPEALHGLIRDYPFATVVASTVGGVVANHFPLEWVKGALYGHVARGNELARMDGAEVMAIFQGPQGYVSPNWYPTKAETHREVPTWNYAVVHVRGRLKIVEDAIWLRALLERLTDHHEAAEPQPWHVGDAPDDHVEKLMQAIVGIEIAVEHVEGKFKLSQNHPERNRLGVIAGLRRRGGAGDAALAEWMAKLEEEKS
ncbi:FMN-binding negative transcriptional regulator [Rhodanobacter sp. 7MK24]|uniref:FMN-binding negative transcriptional regulator n=1 Tax=Rhodanobacter sp. 7MK24 TaxID=2775922 RepID=UPI0017819C7A|nr:FMN-binding negative transcriptional regulator [Rhodanobacter sp. 7MK24]MBD8880406.1 FMN-binding negative transcriptional regulator [Rhodanobacter sp. 7MK24]